MFEIKNVSKKYKSEYAVRNLNLEIGTGLNFILGSSGSGKTTLLKIISGMDNNFDGEVLYLGKSIKNLTDEEKAYYYNMKFGFIYQDFNLIEDMTVEENISLSLHVKNINAKHEVEKVLKRLKIINLRDKKVKFLSGGQKQRVAIGRELVKNPEVIIADEPTSALDSKTALETIAILKAISKERTVIIVTHDTSLLDENSKVYELDKGELISKPEKIDREPKINKKNLLSKFSLIKALRVGKINTKSKISKSIVTCLAVIVSSILLMVSLGGLVLKSGEGEFEKLFEKYGESILDINVSQSFISAEATENTNVHKVDVEQDINGLYNKYYNDSRVEHLVFNRPFDNINIEVDRKKYTINSSSSIPQVNKVVKGNTPKNKGEVLVPEDFVKKMGISNKEAIGKEINFNGSVYNWNSGTPEAKDINIKAKIVGITDKKNTLSDGALFNNDQEEDAFFFDKETLDEVNKQAGINSNNHNFVIRAKNPKLLIEIKNELNKKGIVPIGQFELIEDIVKLDSQTNKLSKGSTIIIATLSVLGLIAVSLVTSIMRKKEYAIYKVSGYSKSQLSLVLFAENIILSVISIISLIILSPIISILTKITFGYSIANARTLLIGILSIVALGVISYLVSSTISNKSNPLIVLKTGGR